MKRLWDIIVWALTSIGVVALSVFVPFIYLLRWFRRSKWLAKTALILVVILITAAAIVYFKISQPLGTSSKEYTVIIRPRDDATILRQRLKEAGIATDRRIYNFMMNYTKADRSLKPGRYRFQGGLSHYELARLFKTMNPELSKVTIPEGHTVAEIVPVLVSKIPTDSTELVSLLRDESFRKELGVEAPSFEGYLFPETYSFYPYQEAREVIREMVMTFKGVFSAEMTAQLKSSGMTLNQIVTLASLIEAEAADGTERALISSVFHNRLKKGMKLQCDPTVIYALGGLDRPLLRKDLDYDSPYNTYLYFGLPPGPIGSPGLASFKAALNPAQTDYYYFVATGDGRHLFTSTLSQHNSAVAKIKRARKAARQR